MRKNLVPLALIILRLAVAAHAQTPDASAGALLAKLPIPDERRVQAVAFSPDGALLAAGYGFHGDGGVTVWKVSDRSLVVNLLDKVRIDAGIVCVEFSPDGKSLVAASDEGDVLLWTVGDWRTHKKLLSRRGETQDLNFSPDGKTLAYTTDKTALLYDLRSGTTTVIARASSFGRYLSGISFSPDGRFVVVCGGRSIQVWDVEGRKMKESWPTEAPGFFGRLSPDGRHVVSGGGAIYREKVVEVRSFPGGEKLHQLEDFRNGLFAVAVSHSGKLFAVAGGTYSSDGGDLSLWNMDEAREVGFVSFGSSPIMGLAFSPDDRILAAASENGYALLYAVDRIRGSQSKQQDYALCGEVLLEEGKTFIVPFSKVPMPMSLDFSFPWRLEVANPEALAGAAGEPVALRDWAIESSAGRDRARVSKFAALLPNARRAAAASEHIVYGEVRNPGWDEGFVAKVYGDGSFAAANNSGRCLASGHLAQLRTDFDSLKGRLTSAGLLALPKEPLTLGADHYSTRFIELNTGGVPELRSDADDVEVLLKGGPAKKREAFSRIFEKEVELLSALLLAGMRPPVN